MMDHLILAATVSDGLVLGIILLVLAAGLIASELVIPSGGLLTIGGGGSHRRRGGVVERRHHTGAECGGLGALWIPDRRLSPVQLVHHHQIRGPVCAGRFGRRARHRRPPSQRKPKPLGRPSTTPSKT